MSKGQVRVIWVKAGGLGSGQGDQGTCQGDRRSVQGDQGSVQGNRGSGQGDWGSCKHIHKVIKILWNIGAE